MLNKKFLLVVLLHIPWMLSAQTKDYVHPTMGWKISMPGNWLQGSNASYWGPLFIIQKQLEESGVIKVAKDAPPPPPARYGRQFEPISPEDLNGYEIVFYLKDTSDINRMLIQTSPLAEMYKNDTSALYAYIEKSAVNMLANEKLNLTTKISRELLNNRNLLVTTINVRHEKKLVATLTNYYWTNGEILFEAHFSYDNTQDYTIMFEAFSKSFEKF